MKANEQFGARKRHFKWTHRAIFVSKRGHVPPMRVFQQYLSNSTPWEEKVPLAKKDCIGSL